MTRTIAIWGLVLAAGAFALQWLEYQYLARRFSWEIYVALIGTAFAARRGVGRLAAECEAGARAL
jgi:hypothetical protein